MVQTGSPNPDLVEITFLIMKILGLFAALLIGAILLIPRLLHTERLWKSKGSIEGVATATFFGAAGLAAFAGLSPIVGSFADGIAVASTKVIKQVEHYVEKLQIIFAPLFFAIVGAPVDLRGVNVNVNVLYFSAILVAVAIVTKLVGTGLPSLLFLKNRNKALKVGIGLISRGEMGLIVAGVGVSAGVLTTHIYTSVIIMVAASTIITPLLLKAAYKKEPPDSTPPSPVETPE